MRTTVAPLFLLLGAVVGQDPSDAGAERLGVPQAFPTAITASDIDGDAVGGHGLWAAGRDYKVSFHDGFVFVPVLGPGHAHNLPLGWRTLAVRVGATTLATGGGAASPRVAGQRCTYDLADGIREQYEVLANGVEQTFVIAERPAAEGDLVVVGRFATALWAESMHTRHAALRFRDADGRPIVDYGAATAVDAAGRRVPMTTSWNGETVELRLAAADVAAAAFPLVVDPLTTTVPVDAGGPGAGAVVDVAIGRNTTSSRPMLVGFARQSSASDHDLFVFSGSTGYGAVTPIFQDLSTSWSTRRPALAFVGAADRWVVAFERDFGSSTSVRCITVPGAADAAVTAVNLLSNPTGFQVSRRPALGGTGALSTSGTKALLVHQSDVTTSNADTANSELFGRFLDLAGGGFVAGAPFTVGTSVGTRYDRHNAAVNVENGGGNASWIVVCQQYDHLAATPSWRAGVWRVANNGAFYGPSLLFLPNNAHALTPRVAGSDGEYYLALTRRSNTGNATLDEFGTALDVLRLDFPQTAANATFGARRTVPMSSASVGAVRLGGIAMDTESRSHAAVVWQQVNYFGLDSVGIARVGATGVVVERQDLYRNSTRPAGWPAVCFDDDADEFDCAFNVDTPTPGVYARSLAYPADARTELYGTSCGGTIGTNHEPRVGDFGFAVTLTNAVPSQLAVIALSSLRSNLPLAGAGMPGCSLYIGIDPGNLIATLPAVVRTNGTTELFVPLPEWEDYGFDFTAQWFWFDPAAGGIGLSATGGIEVFVR